MRARRRRPMRRCQTGWTSGAGWTSSASERKLEGTKQNAHGSGQQATNGPVASKVEQRCRVDTRRICADASAQAHQLKQRCEGCCKPEISSGAVQKRGTLVGGRSCRAQGVWYTEDRTKRMLLDTCNPTANSSRTDKMRQAKARASPQQRALCHQQENQRGDD